MCLAVPQVCFDYVIYHIYIYEMLEKRAGSGRGSLVIAENYRYCGLKIRKDLSPNKQQCFNQRGQSENGLLQRNCDFQ